MDRERRAQWKARIELHRRGGRITDGAAFVALALLKRLGQDGRCDPSHATLAEDSGESISTVRRALKALAAAGCCMLTWAQRLTRRGRQVQQTSNAYVLTLGEAPTFPVNRCECQKGREKPFSKPSSLYRPLVEPTPEERKAARQGLAARQEAVLAAMASEYARKAARHGRCVRAPKVSG